MLTLEKISSKKSKIHFKKLGREGNLKEENRRKEMINISTEINKIQ